MKVIIIFAFVTLISLSVRAQSDTSKSNWSYNDKINEMTSDHSYYAETSDNSGDIKATLIVRYSKKDNDVLLTVSGGIFNIGVNGMFFKAKFDNSKIEEFSGTQPSDGSFDTIFIHGTKNFIKKIKLAKVTYIEIELYNAGTHTFKFDTENLKWEH